MSKKIIQLLNWLLNEKTRYKQQNKTPILSRLCPSEQLAATVYKNNQSVWRLLVNTLEINTRQ